MVWWWWLLYWGDDEHKKALFSFAYFFFSLPPTQHLSHSFMIFRCITVWVKIGFIIVVVFIRLSIVACTNSEGDDRLPSTTWLLCVCRHVFATVVCIHGITVIIGCRRRGARRMSSFVGDNPGFIDHWISSWVCLHDVCMCRAQQKRKRAIQDQQTNKQNMSTWYHYYYPQQPVNNHYYLYLYFFVELCVSLSLMLFVVIVVDADIQQHTNPTPYILLSFLRCSWCWCCWKGSAQTSERLFLLLLLWTLMVYR